MHDRPPLRPPSWPLAVCVLALPPGAILAVMAGYLWAPFGSIALMAAAVVVIRRAQWLELARIRGIEQTRRSEIDRAWRS